MKRLEHVHAVIDRDEGRDPATLSAQPMDVSEGGIKLRVGAALEFEEPIGLKLRTEDGHLDLTLSCRVSWLRKEDKASWLIGCNFVPELPSEALQRMFTTGLIERRRFRRDAVSGRAVAKWELLPGAFGVRTVDISEAGFCILCPKPGQTGQRMLLSHGTGDATITLQAKAQWCAKLERVYLVGCAFVDHQGYLSLKEALGRSGHETPSAM
ncbi:MAG: PilZ domain-containing protein [Planctomycetes bacterium]|nr:PilZ domain-containing protein [Planctomycetota bacterium]